MRNNTPNAFHQYILENQERFYRIAFYYCKDRDTALDIVQNAILKALENFESLRNKNAIKTWFYRILTNECFQSLNKQKREFPIDSSELEETPYLPSFYDGENEKIHSAIEQLSEKYRTVIILHYFEEFTLKEIASITNINVSTVKTRLYSSLKKLKQTLKED